MDAAELARETRSSVEVTRNAKGDYQWVIKRYYDHNLAESEFALKDIAYVDQQLRAAYLPKPTTDAELEAQMLQSTELAQARKGGE